MEYKSNLPYPKVRVERKNIEYAKMLSYSFAGNVSEDTAIHSYMYQSFILNEEFSNILQNIAIVEMHHLKILAKIIKMLGIDPKYQIYYDGKYWSSNYVDYNKNLKEILENNIESETMAINNYKKLIEIIDDKYIKEILNRIIIDEEIHLSIFNKIKEQV